MSLRASLPAGAILALFLTACSGTPERKVVTYTVGEKAAVEKLTYSVVDTQILPRLGEDSAPRNPQNRFYIVDLAVSNAANDDLPIPGMALIDDSGKVYDELADGSGVPKWLGVARRVQANQTEQGSVVFDAPAGHYKLRLTDDTDPGDVFVDIPLSFAHEQMQNETSGAQDSATQMDGSQATAPTRKK
jgi:hypothetical protein